MAVNLLAPADLLPVAGVSLGVASAAIKKPGRDDLLVMRFAPGTVAGGVFTQNAFAAAPVHLCRTRLASGAGRLRALLINSGNANAATGDGGAEDAATLTHALAAQLGCESAQVWPFSTGVIGVRLPVARMRDALPRALAAACVTVDSDTSTNDSFVIAATGAVGGAPFAEGSADALAVREAIFEVCETLAQAIARDGEGATRFVTIDVARARSRDEARQVAMSIANSPLVKTALFAGDANWGRLVMAIGKAGVEGLDPAGVDLRLDDVALLAGGQPHPDYTEAAGTAVLAQAAYTITVSLGRGDASIRCWTCDFSYDYVKINAEYRT